MKLYIAVYLTLYIILLSLSIGIFYVFKPFTYVDNNKSLITCSKDGRSFEAGWNFVYTFNKSLDSFNDAKARKLCQYNAIKDYADYYKTPATINYQFVPKYIQESSWGDALVMFFAFFILGLIIIETLNNQINHFVKIDIKKLLVLSTISILFFFLFIRKPSSIVYCHRQIAKKVNNFKRDIFKYGIFPILEEDKHISSVLPSLYNNCLKSEGF